MDFVPQRPSKRPRMERGVVARGTHLFGHLELVPLLRDKVDLALVLYGGLAGISLGLACIGHCGERSEAGVNFVSIYKLVKR